MGAGGEAERKEQDATALGPRALPGDPAPLMLSPDGGEGPPAAWSGRTDLTWAHRPDLTIPTREMFFSENMGADPLLHVRSLLEALWFEELTASFSDL